MGSRVGSRWLEWCNGSALSKSPYASGGSPRFFAAAPPFSRPPRLPGGHRKCVERRFRLRCRVSGARNNRFSLYHRPRPIPQGGEPSARPWSSWMSSLEQPLIVEGQRLSVPPRLLLEGDGLEGRWKPGTVGRDCGWPQREPTRTSSSPISRLPGTHRGVRWPGLCRKRRPADSVPLVGTPPIRDGGGGRQEDRPLPGGAGQALQAGPLPGRGKEVGLTKPPPDPLRGWKNDLEGGWLS